MMNVAYFTHSLVSDWNHGNAHFQRGILSELLHRGHRACAWEPAAGWSRQHLREENPRAEADFARRFPRLRSRTYQSPKELEAALDRADLVLVHEWTDPEIVAEIGRIRARGAPFVLLFHDTHHRAVSAADEMSRYDLSAYDGVLAFGESLREVYVRRGWGNRVWTWREAADPRVFRPHPEIAPTGDVIWIGNWGDGERTEALRNFLFEPAKAADATLDVYGVRYPPEALDQLARCGARYHGRIANAEVPRILAAHRMTIHVPRGFYARALPGIPTIRVFEALACGIPLISAPWEDQEGLFRVGEDFVVARDGDAVRGYIRQLKEDPAMARELALNGLETILSRHTCAHRVDELLRIVSDLTATTEERRVTA